MEQSELGDGLKQEQQQQQPELSLLQPIALLPPTTQDSKDEVLRYALA